MPAPGVRPAPGRPPRRKPDADGGFLLVESIVAVAVIMIVMTSLAVLLATVSRVTAHQSDAQAAARLAVGALDVASSVGAAGAVSGRDAISSAAQLAATPVGPGHPAGAASVAPWLATMTVATDPTAQPNQGTTAATALRTVARPQTLDGLTYSVSYFVGYCYRDPSSSAGGDCVATRASGSAIQYVRVVVVVAWLGSSCGTAGCDYVSAILLNGSGDPVFDVNQAGTPTLAVKPVPAQSSVVGRAVAGLSGITGCAASPCPVSTSGGAPPLVYSATGLPAGLSMDKATGIVSGTPTTTGSPTVTITVTDAFLNSAKVSFTWKVTRS